MAVRFRGGIHPKSHKNLTRDLATQKLSLPEKVVIPLSQHIGAPATPVVKKGDTVRTGDVIGEANGAVSVPVHATVSGKVKSVEPESTPLGRRVLSVIIESDGKDEKAEFSPIEDREPDKLREGIKSAGIVGLGGACFPTHIKLSPKKPVDTVILNGSECEPYLTADFRIMVEEPEKVVEGFKIILSIIKPERAVIAIEEDKRFAASTLAKYAKDIEIVTLPVRYPQGGEKQLIYAITGREVPSGGLPADVGVLVQNVGTAKAIYDAIFSGMPLIEKVVTVTGEVESPKNLRVRIGTPIELLLNEARPKPSANKVVMGGPMMGIAQWDLSVPVIKGTSGILVLEERPKREYQCFWCGRCVAVCPMGLLPVYIASFSERNEFLSAKDYGVLDCIECGCCAYSCPARRPIVHLVKLAKSKLR